MIEPVDEIKMVYTAKVDETLQTFSGRFSPEHSTGCDISLMEITDEGLVGAYNLKAGRHYEITFYVHEWQEIYTVELSYIESNGIRYKTKFFEYGVDENDAIRSAIRSLKENQPMTELGIEVVGFSVD